MALVTGASSGIGEAFAWELARRGMNLVLVARSADKLDRLARELESKHGVGATPLALDLTDPSSVKVIAQEATSQQWHIDLLVNNAGFGTHGVFASENPEEIYQEVELNVQSLVQLTRWALPPMLSRKRGGIINVASTAGFQPLPQMAVYGATKAFVVSFSEAVSVETDRHGVAVTAVCPGYTATNFFNDLSGGNMGRPRRPDDVVQTALRALEKGQWTAIDGFANQILALTPRMVSRRLTAKVSGILMK